MDRAWRSTWTLVSEKADSSVEAYLVARLLTISTNATDSETDSGVDSEVACVDVGVEEALEEPLEAVADF